MLSGPVTLGCGAGCGCNRPATLGDGEARFSMAPPTLGSGAPLLTQVLVDYATAKLRAGLPFYITPGFNSAVLRLPPQAHRRVNLGFFVIDDIVAAAATVAAVVKPVAEIAAVANMVKGQATSKGGSGVTADQIAAAVLPNVQAQLAAKGVSLPGDVAHQAVAASILDSFGPKYHNLVLVGLFGLGALVLVKLIRG